MKKSNLILAVVLVGNLLTASSTKIFAQSYSSSDYEPDGNYYLEPVYPDNSHTTYNSDYANVESEVEYRLNEIKPFINYLDDSITVNLDDLYKSNLDKETVDFAKNLNDISASYRKNGSVEVAGTILRKLFPNIYYGNWCGPKSSGGPNRNKKPVDYLDEVCMYHDNCYMRLDILKRDIRFCDVKMVDDLVNLEIKHPGIKKWVGTYIDAAIAFFHSKSIVTNFKGNGFVPEEDINGNRKWKYVKDGKILKTKHGQWFYLEKESNRKWCKFDANGYLWKRADRKE